MVDSSVILRKPLVSVIMPAYNRESVISRAIDSLLKQTCDNWECIIVDDGSIDGTARIVNQYCAKDARIKWISNERKKGANGARNTGISHAIGDYISFLDTDDEYLPDTIESQIKEFQTRNIDFLYSDIWFVNAEGQITPHDMNLGIQGNVYPLVLDKGFLSPGIVISVKKECIKAVGMWDESLPSSQDDDLCFKLSKNYTVGFVDKVLAIAHASNNQISSDQNRVSMGWWMLWNKYESDVLAYCGKEVMAKHYKECLHNFIQSNNVKMSRKAYKKYSHFGGTLPKRRRLWLLAFFLSGGKNGYINRKIKNKL